MHSLNISLHLCTTSLVELVMIYDVFVAELEIAEELEGRGYHVGLALPILICSIYIVLIGNQTLMLGLKILEGFHLNYVSCLNHTI